MIKNIVPKNMISMSHMKTKTVYKPGEKPDEQAVEGMNMLGVIAWVLSRNGVSILDFLSGILNTYEIIFKQI